jgi:hypothetical protein
MSTQESELCTLLEAAKEAVALLDGMWTNKDQSPAYLTARVVAKLEAAIRLVEAAADVAKRKRKPSNEMHSSELRQP